MSSGGGQTTQHDHAPECIYGCDRVSSGCKHCPTCRLRELCGLDGVVERRPMSYWLKLLDPYRVKPVSYVLWCPTSDPCHQRARQWWKDLVEIMVARPDVLFCILTKRLENASQLIEQFGPLPNLWLGTSFENQQSLERRARELFAIPAAGYILSGQPLLSPVDMTPYLGNKKLYHVLAGREIGDNARPCNNEWLRSIETQCSQYPLEFSITHYTDANGKAVTVQKKNQTGSNNPRYPGYNPNYRNMPTIGEMMGLQRFLQLPAGYRPPKPEALTKLRARMRVVLPTN